MSAPLTREQVKQRLERTALLLEATDNDSVAEFAMSELKEAIVWLVARAEAAEEDLRRAKRSIEELRAETVCPACGCASPSEAEASECGCDHPVCARERPLTEAYTHAVARAEAAERENAEHDRAMTDLHALLDEARAERDALAAQVNAMREALLDALALIEAWHNLGEHRLPAEDRGRAWAIYRANAPEIQPIVAALDATAAASLEAHDERVRKQERERIAALLKGALEPVALEHRSESQRRIVWQCADAIRKAWDADVRERRKGER